MNAASPETIAHKRKSESAAKKYIMLPTWEVNTGRNGDSEMMLNSHRLIEINAVILKHSQYSVSSAWVGYDIRKAL